MKLVGLALGALLVLLSAALAVPDGAPDRSESLQSVLPAIPGVACAGEPTFPTAPRMAAILPDAGLGIALRPDSSAAPERPTPTLAGAPAAPESLTPARGSPELVLDGLYLLCDGDTAEFERWFSGARVDDLVVLEHRAMRASSADEPRRRAAHIDAEMQSLLRREQAWLTAQLAPRLATAPLDEDELDRLWIPIGVSDGDVDARYASVPTDVLVVDLWHAAHAERVESTRRSEERFALGLYTASRAAAEG